MITDEELDQYRLDSTVLRVIRDAVASNDIKGIVMAWDDEFVMVRKQNRKVLKLSRLYTYQPFQQDR